MNSLSWFLYLADVFDNLRHAFLSFVIVGSIAAVACTIAGIFMHGGHYSWVTDKDREWWEGKRTTCANWARVLWPATMLAVLFLALLPSKNTFYAIAASEVGEQVVKSEAVQGIANDATKALHQWIKKQIEPDAKK